MSDASLERTFHFFARHRYHVESWTEERNREVFGDLAALHGHDYAATVTVTGPMDPETGFCTDLGALDARLTGVRDALHDGVLNEVIPEVATGRAQPSCEVVARWLFGQLRDAIPGDARLVRVRVAESPELAAYWPGVS